MMAAPSQAMAPLVLSDLYKARGTKVADLIVRIATVCKGPYSNDINNLRSEAYVGVRGTLAHLN